MRPAELALYRSPQPFRWLSDRLWRIEHAFERAKAADKAEDSTRLRMFFILLVFLAGFVILGAMATRAALFSGIAGAGAAGDLPDQRADLVDRNGQLLAIDLPHFGLYYDPRDNWNADEVRRDLSTALPQLSPQRLDAALKADKRQYLIGGLTPAERQQIDDLGLPGVTFETESRRVYPLGPTAAHLIGFVDKGGVGLAGAERALEGPVHQSTDGKPVALAIDLRVQAALQDELAKAAGTFKAIGGVGIVTNVRTGEILGMASYPFYDPNNLSAATPDQMLNRVAAARYEPGSVFKVFTVAMGLDSGVATLDTKFDARSPLVLEGRSKAIHDFDKGDTYLPLWEVFTHSSNIGAARLGILAGKERMDHYFHAFGLYGAAPSELAESARPIVPKELNDSTIASMSFGQAISVSPLALATGMGSILNGGEYIPLTIRKIDQPPKGHRVISEETSRQMLDLMRLNAVQGTGRSAEQQAPGYRLGGKTGTAQKPVGGRYDATKKISSFAGVFPTDGPIAADRYFVLVLLDEPQGNAQTGGWATGAMVAAPAVGKVVERIAPYLGVRRAPISLLAASKPALTPQQLNGEEH
jgi:cell division protein FtsI (penicillin-binding protein 3)